MILGPNADSFRKLGNVLIPLWKQIQARVAAADPADDWSISLYPDGHPFAFTLVHDADGAYSRRLSPLFDAFDGVGLKITATAFMFWADWAKDGRIWNDWKKTESSGEIFFAPQCVPLADDTEREFYVELSRRGHEIGMHTPSETSSTRPEIVRGFEFFKQVFGSYPTVYVEHSGSTKKDAQRSEGSTPESTYYNIDLLNSYGPWVWLDDFWGVPHNRHARFYDIIAANGSPFNDVAPKQYGILKAFLRTGKWAEGDGDGFLAWYSEENIDSLEKNRGIALVYTHLDKKWLDPETKKIRTAIRDRLRYLTSKNGWFVPAGTILDRVQAVQKIKLYFKRRYLRVANTGSEVVKGLTLISKKRRSLRCGHLVLNPTSGGEIVVGVIQPGETISFKIV
ncbi:MAG TPA: hypothetical protein VLX11_03405 [Candidatus Acidoferrales bacterium]|nr:hypothetical protein [Candidatus Acidoferrales bacterium]